MRTDKLKSVLLALIAITLIVIAYENIKGFSVPQVPVAAAVDRSRGTVPPRVESELPRPPLAPTTVPPVRGNVQFGAGQKVVENSPGIPGRSPNLRADTRYKPTTEAISEGVRGTRKAYAEQSDAERTQTDHAIQESVDQVVSHTQQRYMDHLRKKNEEEDQWQKCSNEQADNDALVKKGRPALALSAACAAVLASNKPL